MFAELLRSGLALGMLSVVAVGSFGCKSKSSAYRSQFAGLDQPTQRRAFRLEDHDARGDGGDFRGAPAEARRGPAGSRSGRFPIEQLPQGRSGRFPSEEADPTAERRSGGVIYDERQPADRRPSEREGDLSDEDLPGEIVELDDPSGGRELEDGPEELDRDGRPIRRDPYVRPDFGGIPSKLPVRRPPPSR